MNPIFVVGLDREGVLRRRATVRRVRLIGGWIAFVVSLVGMALPLALLLAAPEAGVGGFIMLVGMVPLVFITALGLWKSMQVNRWNAATDLPPFAMRMSPAALELGCEGAAEPVILPWQAFPGFKLRRRYGRLVLVLASRIRSNTPGVLGLDQPAVVAPLGHDWLLKSAGFYSLSVLDQPVGAIDDALRYFSGGRAGIRGQQLRARKR